jgi:hypothetical protein
MAKTVQEIVRDYHEAALQLGSRDVTLANAAANRVQDCYDILRRTEEGRSGLLALIDNEDPAVRLCAAGHCLHWAAERARAVLETLRDSNGLWSFEAKWTLIEFEKGRSTLDHSQPSCE